MSETIDLNQKYFFHTVKRHILGGGVACVLASMFNLMALYDYSKLSSKVDDDVKGMLPQFIYPIVGNFIFWPFFIFLLIKFPNRTFYKVLSICMMISALVGFIFQIFVDKNVERKKYYPGGFKNFLDPPPPPPPPVRMVRRRRSVQKNVASGGEEGDDDSSE
ncbi:hypothetical protein CAEBREN_11324 [Caenorhabditis brenneri]|uniref:Uncharacterized protein n=1 Tax=Caenorhabditis brenneri TaxID=135651 RepID=G0PH09_CAEBE|nr:hypothetical protein CAEBREN_11324 [Caenorhabditis brenneri]